MSSFRNRESAPDLLLRQIKKCKKQNVDLEFTSLLFYLLCENIELALMKIIIELTVANCLPTERNLSLNSKKHIKGTGHYW